MNFYSYLKYNLFISLCKLVFIKKIQRILSGHIWTQRGHGAPGHPRSYTGRDFGRKWTYGHIPGYIKKIY